MHLNYQFSNIFKGFTIFLCQIHLPLENKTSKSEFFSNFLWISMFYLKTWTIRYSILFFSLKLHKLPYLNLFIGFNNILKKIPFSCYIKCNTSHLNEKIFFSFRKRIFSVFSLHILVLIENEGKRKKYINFLLQFISFFSKLHKLSPFQRF